MATYAVPEVFKIVKFIQKLRFFQRKFEYLKVNSLIDDLIIEIKKNTTKTLRMGKSN